MSDKKEIPKVGLETMNIKSALNIIKDLIPGNVESTKIHNTSWKNLVIEVNNKYIFRFPKSKESKDLLRKEILFLNKFALCAPVNLPVPLFSNDDFMCYKKINGISLTPNIFKKLSLSKREKLAKNLAKFLQWLHRINFKNKEIPTMVILSKKLFMNNLNKIPSKLSAIAKEKSFQFFEKANFDIFNSVKKVLIHNDFGEGNILIDNNKLSGIIDFGRLMYGYPEMDFAKLWRNYGKDFAKTVLDLCDYDEKKFEFIATYDLFRKEPFVDKIEEIFGK